MRRLKKQLWPYYITVNEHKKIEDIEVWLTARVGAYREQWHAVYYSNKTDFYFKQAPNTTMFALKWK